MKIFRNHWAKRMVVQTLSAIGFNLHLSGYVSGEIYTGDLKSACVPVLNCYSCPGALGACPIGSLQAVEGSKKFQVSFYVLGFMMLFGMLWGRFICGFLCPFGWLQDILDHLKKKKWIVPPKLDRILRYVKYLVLFIVVILLSMVLTNKYGIAAPYFCEYVCPAGTLGAGVPLVLLNESLQSVIGPLFVWKVSVLVVILFLSVVIYRPFCKYLCPLGAFYALFNKISFYQMNLNEKKCTKCGLCERTCKMQVPVMTNINSAECIRCNECKAVCPTGAISSGYFAKDKCSKEKVND